MKLSVRWTMDKVSKKSSTVVLADGAGLRNLDQCSGVSRQEVGKQWSPCRSRRRARCAGRPGSSREWRGLPILGQSQPVASRSLGVSEGQRPSSAMLAIAISSRIFDNCDNAWSAVALPVRTTFRGRRLPLLRLPATSTSATNLLVA